MKITFVLLLPLLCLTAHAQSSDWNVHPLNMVPCQEWIYPEPGCGGCSSCRTAIDSDPLLMHGGALQWSEDLVMCPHPVDTQGNNAVIINNWPVEPNPGSFIYGHVDFHERMRLDTVELTCAAWSPGTDSVELAIQFNETDPLTTTTLLTGQLSGAYQRYTVADIGLVPMNGNGTATANFFVRTHGTDVWLLFKGLRVVASVDQTASIADAEDQNVLMLPQRDGVTITALRPTSVSVCDAEGRITYTRSAVTGTTCVPLADGVSIVRAGAHVRRFVR